MYALRVWSPALLATLTLTILTACSSPDSTVEVSRRVRVALPQPASAAAANIFPGTVQARFESALGFRVAGKIRARLVDSGAEVKRGALLAELDPDDMKLAETGARAALASAQAALAQARSEHDRFQALYAKHYVSQLEHDAKVNALAAAQAQVTQARARLESARNQQDYTQLRADADGVITQISAEPGQVVAAGQAVLTLAHAGAREVEINLPEQQVAQHRLEEDVGIELWSETGAVHAGRIREIAPAADAVTRTYRARIALVDNQATPRLGQTARVHFNADATRAQWRLPLSALYEKDGQPAVWRLDPASRQLHLVAVTVASYDTHDVLLSSGVRGEDWIATAGVHRLREGETVLPIDARDRPIPL